MAHRVPRRLGRRGGERLLAAAGVVLSAQPSLSIVVALQSEGTSPEACLDSLSTQIDDPALVEILLIDGTRAGWSCSGSLGEKVRVVRAPTATSLPLLLGHGLEASRGQLVAFTEAHVTFDEGWVERALTLSTRRDVAAVGGAVEPGQDLRMLDRAVFLCDYFAFLRPFNERRVASLPGCNVVFQRRFLERVEHPAEIGFWKTFHCDELLARGETLLLDPALGCRHHLHKSWRGWLRKRLVHGRCYGGMRRRGWSLPRRLLYGISAPLVPFVLFARLTTAVWPRVGYRSLLVTHAPLCYLALAAWVAGEWLGNLSGPGQSCQEV